MPTPASASRSMSIRVLRVNRWSLSWIAYCSSAAPRLLSFGWAMARNLSPGRSTTGPTSTASRWTQQAWRKSRGSHYSGYPSHSRQGDGQALGKDCSGPANRQAIAPARDRKTQALFESKAVAKSLPTGQREIRARPMVQTGPSTSKLYAPPAGNVSGLSRLHEEKWCNLRSDSAR